MQGMHPDVTLTPLQIAEIPDVAALARSIFRESHTRFVSDAQIEHMLRDRFMHADMAPYVDAKDRWFDVLRVDGNRAGILRCTRSGADVLKLDQIYLAKAYRGKGLGQLMLDRAESLARDDGCTSVLLYVNRRNDDGIAAYRRHGFVVVDVKITDIGNGFVMDDLVMAMALPAQ